jgi:hypothetical protein
MDDTVDPISGIFVDTSRAKAAFERIEMLLKHGWEKTYCRALLLAGPSRSGKTTIVDRYIDLRIGKLAQRPPIPPIVRVDVTQGCTLKSYVTEVLIKLGDPDPEYGSQAEKTRRVGRPCLTHDLFAETIDMLRIGSGRKLPNPFRIERPVPVPPAPMHVEDVARSPTRGGRNETAPKPEGER